MNKFIYIVLAIFMLIFSFACSERKSQPEDYFNGLKAFSRGDYSEASRLMTTYSKANPDLAIPHYWLGLIEFAGGDSDLARRHFREALEIAPGFWPAAERLGYLELCAGDLRGAKEAYERYVSLKPHSADAQFRLGLTKLLAFDNESSVKWLTDALKENPSHVPAAMMAMFPLQYLDDLEGAERVLKLASEARPDSALVKLLRARNKQLMGEVEKAESLYLRAMELDPHYSKIPMELANRIYIPNGEYDKAVKMLRLAIELEPERNSNRLDLGFLLFIKGEHQQAEKAFREALEYDPSGFGAYLGLAKVEVERGNWEKARQHLSKALELNPGYERAGRLIKLVSDKLSEKEGSRQ